MRAATPTRPDAGIAKRDAHANNPTKIEPLFLIWGQADYEDVFEDKHTTKWCYRVRLDRHDGKKLNATFIQWGGHNIAT